MSDVKLFVNYLVYGILEGDANVSEAGEISNSDVRGEKELPHASEIYDQIYERTLYFFETQKSSLKDDVEEIREYIVEEKAKHEQYKQYQNLLNKLI